MKNVTNFMVVTLSLLLSSCSIQVYPIRGEYNVIRYTETTSSYDEVWDKVIDFFAINNVSISTIEKSSGIIVSNDFVIGKSYISSEDKMGLIENPNAWFVMPYGSKNTSPISLQCSINVRVKEIKGGKVSIAINIGNIMGQVVTFNLTGFITSPSYDFISTGVFERTLLDRFK